MWLNEESLRSATYTSQIVTPNHPGSDQFQPGCEYLSVLHTLTLIFQRAEQWKGPPIATVITHPAVHPLTTVRHLSQGCVSTDPFQSIWDNIIDFESFSRNWMRGE